MRLAEEIRPFGGYQKNLQREEMNWADRRVLITGGASFIGSHLVDALVRLGAKVRVADNLRSGKLEHIQPHISRGDIQFFHGNLLDIEFARKVMVGADMVFHLAAAHGGRGYISRHVADCASNMALDNIVFLAAHRSDVEKLVYTSSGCVYPRTPQDNPYEKVFLSENMVRAPYDADGVYGWGKLMGEIALKSYYDQYGFESVICRLFTAYGPRATESHAIMAIIARSYLKENPIAIWGTGQQIRNWTFVSDVVDGLLLASEKGNKATAFNIGTSERIRLVDAVEEVLRYTRHSARLEFMPSMPTGPYNRVADVHLASEVLGWTPQVNFVTGLHQTIDWYFATKSPEEAQLSLSSLGH